MAENEVIGGRVGLLPPTLAQKLVLEMFGGRVQRRQSGGTTGTGAVQIVQGNPDRIGLQLVNNSAAEIYVGFTPDTSATQSIILAAGGGSLVLKFRDDGQVCGDAIYGLSGAGGDAFTVIETILWGS